MKHLFYPFLLAALLLCTACDKEPGGEQDPTLSGGSSPATIVGSWAADYEEYQTSDGRTGRREIDRRVITFTPEGAYIVYYRGRVDVTGIYVFSGNQLTVTTDAEDDVVVGTPGNNYPDTPGSKEEDDDGDAFPGTGGTRAATTYTETVTVLTLTDSELVFTGSYDDGEVYTTYFHRLTDGDTGSDDGDDDDDDNGDNGDNGDDDGFSTAADPETARDIISGSWRFDRQETVAGGTTETDWFDGCRILFYADGTLESIAGITTRPGRFEISAGGPTGLVIDLIYTDGETLRYHIKVLNYSDLILTMESTGPDGDTTCITYLTRLTR